MHIFCTECGKHIDVSLEELENQEGHLVCPQCLAEIDVDDDLFKTTTPSEYNSDSIGNNDDIDTHQHMSSNNVDASLPPIPDIKPSADAIPVIPAPAPVSAAQQQPHVDDVMRVCRFCGAFLREGVNFCPRCGKYVRVAPPAYKPQNSPAQQMAAKLRASTPPVRRTPPNKQSTYKPIQEPPYQTPPVKQPLRDISNSSTAYSARNSASRNNSSKKKSSKKFSILSIGGCLTLTVVVVALFFILYIVIFGVLSEG